MSRATRAAARPWRDRLGALPRDTRDTLFMLVLIAWTIAPHLLRLSPWLGTLCAFVLAWRTRLALRQGALPGRVSLLAVLLLAAGMTWWTHRTLLGRDAGVTLLVLLMALKTLELRARRDALVVFFLGFFLVLTNFLYSQSLPTALAMGVSVWGWLTALTLAHMPAGTPRLRDAGALAARAALVGTPIMVALFLLFPRIGPLWALPGSGARTGLSEQLRMGDVAELAQDDSIALRIKVAGPALPAHALYFRGPVLSRYDGTEWRVEPSLIRMGDALPNDIELAGPATRYELTLEPLRIAWLPLLEHTPLRPDSQPLLDNLRASADDSGQWRLRSPLSQRVQLTAQAWTGAHRGLGVSEAQMRELTELPARLHPRTRAWARALASQPELRQAQASQMAAAVMQHIREAGFSYTLSPGRYEGDAVDGFWLDRREGFCEHFASAFVVVMRSVGIPARIVTGYQGADAVVADGWQVVRQSNAHAWAEYWQAGKGWQRADPTAAVAPDRIDRGSALQAPKGLVAGALDAVDPGLRLRLRQWAEALDQRWNLWVLSYGRQQQFKLLQNLGFETPDATDLARFLGLLVAGAALVGAAWAWRDARQRTPWQRLQARIASALEALDVPAPVHAGPGGLAQQVSRVHGTAGAALAHALRSLEAMRYGPHDVGSARQQRERWNAWWRDFEQHCAALRARRQASR